MADPSGPRDRKTTVLKRVRCEKPWDTFVLPVSAFPVPKAELTPIREFVSELASKIASTRKLASEVFIQFAQLHHEDGPTRLSDHGREWMPTTGLAVWPDREPPTLWTIDELTNVLPGETVRPMMNVVFRLMGPIPARENARDTMMGLGTIIEIMIQGSADEFLAAAHAVLYPPLKEPSLKSFPFYVPLLEAKSFANARAEQLATWLCGAKAYIRESVEDKGILIASDQPLEPLLANVDIRD
ncbi:MAG: hypothetical protein AB1714_15670 [Acidobacteriota bacterium]